MKLKNLKLVLSGLVVSSGLVFYPLLTNKQDNHFSLNKDVSGVENKIPSNVTSVDLTYRVDPSGNAWINGFRSQPGDQYLWVPARDNENHPVVGIDDGVFASGKISLNGIGFAANPNFRQISSNAFNGNKLTQKTPITGLENTGLQTIGYSAFRNSSFTSIGLPSSVTSIDPNAFSYINDYPLVINANWSLDQVKGLDIFTNNVFDDVNLTINAKNPTYNQHDALFNAYYAKFNHKAAASLTVNVEDDKPFDITDNGYIFHREGTTLPNNLVIPLQVDGKDVVGIRWLGFQRETNINSVSFAKGSKVNTINFGAFSECINLTNVTLPDTLNNIGSTAFSNTKLQNIIIPRKTIVFGENCFLNTGLQTVVFNNSNPDTFTVQGNIFGQSRLQKVYIHQDLDHANYGQAERLKWDYLEKFDNFGTLGSSALSTWYDSNPQSPAGELNIYGLNQQYETTLGDGFKTWKDASSTRNISLQYTTSDNSINATGTLNSDNLSFSTTLRQNTSSSLNISRKTVTITPKLVLTDSSNNSTQTISLKPVNITLSPNDNIVSHEPVFNKDNRINVNRDNALWFGNDAYTTTTQINKAYFGDDWNNVNNIKNNLSTYFKFTNNSGDELPLTKNNDYWFNNQLGAISVDITEANETTYNVRFSIQKGRDNNIATLIDQNINCYLKPRTENTPIFSIKTYSANKFKPNITFSGNGSNVNLSLNNQTQRTTWNLDNQTFDSQIAKNDFDWYQQQGYSFRIDSSRFNNQFIGIGSDLRLNTDKTQFSVSVNLKTPNINAVNLNVSGLKVIAYKSGFANIEFNLPTFNVNASKNDNHSINKNTLNKSTEISNNRNGLWINGDTYDTRIVVNKAYFGQNWNSPNYIKNNFNEYINVSGNGQTYQFNHANNTNIYTNPKIGQMTVTGVDQDTNPNSYLIKLWFSVPDSVDYQLLNQTITFDLKNAPSSSGHLFTINTCDKNQFDPNYNNFRANNLNLTSGERTGAIVWNDSDQTEFKNLGNTNTCKWAISKGYTLSLTNFTNDYISIDSNPRFDVNSNTLQVSVTQTKAVPEQTSINVAGLKLKIMNGSTVIRQDITLPSLTVTLGASSTDITTTNLTYTGADQKSLRDKGDTASFDLTIPEVLKPQNDDQLIIN
ncbi:MAG: leucine-rich repeat domain-containing protein [Mycoplasma sp.]